MPLCIGGPMDGKWVDSILPYLKYPSYEQFHNDCGYGILSCDQVFTKVTEYKLEKLWSGDKYYYVYLANDGNEENLIERLINNYRPIKE